MCYRRFGHNESDNPSFTQPTMYQAIEKQKTVVVKYGEQLISSGIVTQEEFDVRL